MADLARPLGKIFFPFVVQEAEFITLNVFLMDNVRPFV
jgi:hypothetical protein